MHNSRHLRTLRPITVVLALLLPAMQCARAADILKYLPEDTLAFALVNNLSDADAKVGRLQRMFEVQFPPPLTYLKYMTGLDEGIDEQGSLMVALLDSPTPQAAVWLAVSDYAQFAQSIGGDPSGKICRTELAGETVLVARKGPYAVFTNTEHRQRMQQLLDAEPKLIAAIQPLSKWIDETEIAIVALPTGIDSYLELARARVEEQSIRANIRSGRARMPRSTKQLQQCLKLFDLLFHSNSRQVEVAAIGLQIDDASNLRWAARLLLAEPAALETSAQRNHKQESPFQGFAEQPYVAVVDTTVSGQWGPACAKAIYYLLDQESVSQSVEPPNPQRRVEEEEILLSVVRRVHSAALLMRPGQEKDPFFGNFYLVLSVEAANEYLETFKQAIERFNALTKTSPSDIKILYELKPTTIDQAKAYEIVSDVGTAVNDPNVPLVNWLIEALVGEGGIFRAYAVALDGNSVLLGVASQEEIRSLIKEVSNQKAGLGDSTEASATLQLLDREAAGKILLSPAGTVQWFDRFSSEFLSLLNFHTAEIPEYPASPPIGISFDTKHDLLEVDMVWPKATLEVLAAYLQTVKSE